MTVSIYFSEDNANIFRYHLARAVGSVPRNWTYFHNIDVFCSSATGRRIALFHIPYPYNNLIEQQIDQLYDHVDDILVIGTELHPPIIDFIRRYDKSKITWYLCGYLNFRLQASRLEKSLDWFTTSVHFYKNVRPSVLHDLQPFETKPLMFDALLGRKKSHRDQAYKFISNNNLLDAGITTYINERQINFKTQNPNEWTWGFNDIDTVNNIENIQWTVDRVLYHGYNISVSQILPIDIYNKTAYSLVCETNADNDYVFYTEKTVKPLIAQRLFITLGAQHHLAGLRNLGFKTFHGIIDESYDSIEPVTERHNAALEQLKWLCSQDQAEILRRARDIIIHNYNHVIGNNWYNLFRQQFIRKFV